MDVKDWLSSKLGQDIWSKKYRNKNETFEQWVERVSGSNKEIKRLIIEKKFLFGGRTLTNRGTNRKGSYSNCYSSGYAPDSVSGIMDLAKELALTYKAQGGQGVSLSKVRPKGTGISGGEFESDGIVPFMEIFNSVTAGISQGGSRKGALMMSISCNHKEIDTFINIKSENNKITKANLSVEVDDVFMKAVDLFYKTGEVVTLDFKEVYEDNTIEYSLKPIEIYKNMITRAYDWAEPAMLYVERFRNYNLMELIEDYQIVTGNACGEQPLPPYGACNLGSQNVSAYVVKPYTSAAYFDYLSFIKDVVTCIKGLDDVLDEGMDLHVLKEQRNMSFNYRNIGLGIMGVGNLFFKMGVKYGSEESKKLLEEIMKTMFTTAVAASANLALEKGSFPKYDEKVYDSSIIKNHFTPEEIIVLKSKGLRNCSLLSIAPTGTLGTMLDISTGIESIFKLSYFRKTESLHHDKEVSYEVNIESVKEYQSINNTENVPDYFVTSGEIAWKDRIDIQAVAQRHVDTAISSTVNLPNNCTLEEVEKLYLYAWEKGLKGITIYRDGCKREGILTSTKNIGLEKTEQKLERGLILEVSDDLHGKKRKIRSGCGTLHIEAWFDKDTGDMMEVFLNRGNGGGCLSHIASNSRLLSIGLRGGIPLNTLCDQLDSVCDCSSYIVRTAMKKDTAKGTSCPMAVGKILLQIQKEMYEELGIPETKEGVSPDNFKKEEQLEITVKKDVCPECGEEVENTGGCRVCGSCGWSKCG